LPYKDIAEIVGVPTLPLSRGWERGGGEGLAAYGLRQMNK
jgi:hypothetical protein